MWDVAAAGHISSGEDNLESIKREFNEELGLDSEKYDSTERYYIIDTTKKVDMLIPNENVDKLFINK